MVQLVLPNDANTLGNVLGGMVLHWIDLAAAIVAHRHCRTQCVTASIDQVSFEAPIRIGQLAVITGRLTYAGRTSMEIRVDVQSEDLRTARRIQTSTAYLTFVAIDEKGAPVPVPPLLVYRAMPKRTLPSSFLTRLLSGSVSVATRVSQRSRSTNSPLTTTSSNGWAMLPD
jgi:acyl-CoA hydrolase